MKKYAMPFVLAGLLLLGGWVWLRSYTRHNSVVIVPDVAGLSVTSSEEALAARGLRGIVIDSVYHEGADPGSVVEQDPDAGDEVKADRKVYLVVNAQQPPMIDMPQLEGLSKRQAISVLDILGLKVAGLEYKPDQCVDCVIEQRTNGERITAGTRVRRGASFTLVLGSGDQGERVPVPDLRGLTEAELSTVLNMASLNRGLVVACEGCNTKADSTLARVYRQSPAPRSEGIIAMGTPIDVWLTMDTVGLKPMPGWNDPARYSTNDSLDVLQ
ncbi:MAG: PASTA domain-containing protein [Flavobacteriales bacterium]|jgi:beta-lactam-binding protein with PASTA domain|nr:PASTA domain-containing protein [Flavobacteriales bacterium]